MGESNDLIDFNVIESHKENIQALPSGRSAKALAQIYSPALLGATPSPSTIHDANSGKRQQFEKEVASIEEADDPLDVYDRYIKWTFDAYPSAQATPQSGLLPLLERAMKAFQSSSHYKNDPRYLKIWLHYIRLFSDAPREAFVFLARHSIGEGLALYYEEYAAWLENAGRWTQAEEVYNMGIERDARPVERLVRKFGEFERRNRARPQDVEEPQSPAIPRARPALAAKADPFSPGSSDAPQAQSRTSAPKKSKGSKMAIFSDTEEPSRPGSANSGNGWNDFGTLSERRKENSHEAKPWAGETLKVGKTNGGMQKMMIFKDQSHLSSTPLSLPSSSHQDQFVFNPKTGRLECVLVNLEVLYPTPTTEFCFEETQLHARGWRPQRQPSKTSVRSPLAVRRSPKPAAMEAQSNRGFAIFEDQPYQQPSQPENVKVLEEKFSKSLALNDVGDANNENVPPSREEIELAKRLRREERANRTRKIQVMDVKHIHNETKTVQLNLDSPNKPKPKRKKSSSGIAEPTMTINTKEAMDEIYGIFNAPLPSQAGPGDDETEESDEDDEDDDYTTDAESTGTGKLSGPASEYGDETKNELFRASQRAQEQEDRDNRTDVSAAWSDFTTSKDVPRGLGEKDESPEDSWGVYKDEDATPIEEEPRTRYVPEPPEGYEATAFRDNGYVPNHRLPFMTPIVERTESSLGLPTTRTEKELLIAKTPSRHVGGVEPLAEDDVLYSSPFQELTADEAEEKRRVLQPIRTKSTKGTLSLGQGTAKAQTTAKVTIAAAASEPVLKGPIVTDARCNPMDPALRETILTRLNPCLTSYGGYYEHLDTHLGRTAEIKKYVRTLSKAGRSSTNPDKTAQTLSLPPMLSLPQAVGTYTVRRELGAGTFAPVYLVENSAVVDAEEEARVGKLVHRKQLEALKMEEPPSAWEFFIISLAHRRLGLSRAAESIVRAHEMHVYRDECFLLEEYRDQGTLLDLVNIARSDSNSGGGLDEMMAMWLTVELLRTVEALHSKQLIHGDLKGDNVLVRFDDPGVEMDWSPTYWPNGAHGWSSKGLCLIDMGRGIDMKHFVPHVGFLADWKTTEADCPEMRELRPWTYQIDYYGMAGIVHSMLFGKYMETVTETRNSAAIASGATNKSYRIRESFKRYWQTELWSEAFALLLNPVAHTEGEEGGRMPVLRGMRDVREKMETYLEENCERGVGLKAMIIRMESAIREKRRKSAR